MTPSRTKHQERISAAMKLHWKKRKARAERVRTGQFRYGQWHALEPLLKAGWMVVGDLGPVHGFWSVLLWRCDCEAAE